MEAILRISGADMDLDEVAATLSAQPYSRETKEKGRARTNCLFYDVASVDQGEFSHLIGQIFLWLDRHSELANVSKRSDVDLIELDIGGFFREHIVAMSRTFGPELLGRLAAMRVSLVVSVYLASGDDG